MRSGKSKAMLQAKYEAHVEILRSWSSFLTVPICKKRIETKELGCKNSEVGQKWSMCNAKLRFHAQLYYMQLILRKAYQCVLCCKLRFSTCTSCQTAATGCV